MEQLQGTGASSGTAVGPVFSVTVERPIVPEFDDPAGAYAEAARAVTEDLEALKHSAQADNREEAAEILGAQALMAADPMLAGAVNELLAAGSTLSDAIDEASASIAALLAQMDDEYLAARAADVEEIAQRIRHRLAGTSADGLATIPSSVVVIADTLTAADTAQLDPSLVLGFVTQQGGPTSHVAVIARSLGIPAVVGAEGAVGRSLGSDSVAMDGDSGEVVFDPSGSQLADFSQRAPTVQQNALGLPSATGARRSSTPAGR